MRVLSNGIHGQQSSLAHPIFHFCCCKCLRSSSMLKILWLGTKLLFWQSPGWYTTLLLHLLFISLFLGFYLLYYPFSKIFVPPIEFRIILAFILCSVLIYIKFKDCLYNIICSIPFQLYVTRSYRFESASCFLR